MTIIILIILCFLIVNLIFQLFKYHWQRRKLYIFSAGCDGPSWTLPIFGNALELGIHAKDYLPNLQRLYNTSPSGFRLWIGSHLHFCLSSPEHVQIILSTTKTNPKGFLYKVSKPFVGNGLITNSDTTSWRSHRKLINATLTMRNLNSFVSVFSAQSGIMVEKLRTKVDGDQFDLNEFVTACTIDIVCETLMGVQMHTQNQQNQEFIKSLEMIYKSLVTRIQKPWLLSDWIFEHSKYGKEQFEALQFFHGFVKKIISSKKQEYKNKFDSKPSSMLEYLIQTMSETDELNDEELFDEIVTLFAASQDTTAVTCCFVFLIFGIKPEIQEKVYQEIRSILGESNRSVVVDDLPKMQYLDMVIKEANRLFPVGVILLRQLQEDFKFEDKVIPAGCNIAISPFVNHRLEKYWGPNCHEFNPDNFLPHKIAERDPYCYIPFSAGPRSCPGRAYSIMCMKTIIAELVSRYKFTTDKKESGLVLTSDISIRSADGFWLKITNRI